MFNNSVLLAIDGSMESVCAAQAAWRFAEQVKDGSVTAQYVLDGPAVWKFLGYDRVGFIGSGPYVAGYLNVCNSLRSVGNALMTSYSTHAEAHAIKSQTVIDEGGTIEEICKRAENHDMVVVGHRGARRCDDDYATLLRLSVSEKLARFSPKPLLIVQDDTPAWTSAKFLMGSKLAGVSDLRAFLDFCKVFNMEPNLTCLVEQGQKKEFAQAYRALAIEDQALADSVVLLENIERVDDKWHPAPYVEPNSLVVLPAIRLPKGREISFGADLKTVLANLEQSAVLIWPIETVIEAPRATVPAAVV